MIGHHDDLTMCVLGCGSLGTAILSGILSSLAEMEAPKPLQTPSSGTSTPAETLPQRLPSQFIACVRRPESAKKVKAALWEHTSSVKVVWEHNVASVQQSEVVLLACKPSAVEEILKEPGMTKALHGKLLISICAGVTVEQIEKHLHGAVPDRDPEEDGRCRIVRALPNAASLIRESMTVVADDNQPSAMPAATMQLVTWIFRRIGDVVFLPTSAMNASTALCGSGPAFFALVLEAAIDGAVAMGLPRAEAQRMAAQTMKGAAGLVLNGEHPALLRDKVGTPGGCSIGGLLVLEEGAVRGTVSRAVREAATVAGRLGNGAQGVNGTRLNGFEH
ncbi:Pyrroline-5-carboxylate reductase [Cytospora mali]|uniref:Pyrroline-5-carboxylate reductase n=1 Tax=Cytospora mali TaxID=578113 RepID=A0A194V5W2_CYTMA|nr:Pyrroline-5-carboxylate reductase [Valsa mali var. pyri (nom. inval.)]